MTRFPAVGGGGGEQPIASKDRAETFSENDVTVTGTAIVDNESVKIDPNNRTVRGSINVASGDSGESNNSNSEIGVAFVPSVDAERVDTVKLSGTEFYGANSNDAELRTDDGTTLDVVGAPENGITFTADLTAGEKYWIYATGPDSYSYGYNSNYQPTVSGDGVDIVEVDSANNSVPLFGEIEVSEVGLEGSMTVSWPDPADIYRWDAATFQAAPDGETVEVHVEESTDSGSTWTEIQGPISRGDQIEADPGSRVRFRVELARSDASNNPTLDAIYRRWVV